MTSLFLGNGWHAPVEIVRETEKAIQFSAVANSRHTLWVPKKALKADHYVNDELGVNEFIGYEVAVWFHRNPKNDWTNKFFCLYTESIFAESGEPKPRKYYIK